VVSLATKGQLGLTANARNLELIIRRLAAKKNAELEELRRQLYDLAKKVAPSIILFTEASPYEAQMMDKFGGEIGRLIVTEKSNRQQSAKSGPKEIELTEYSRDGDELILAGLLFSAASLSFKEALRKVKRLSHQQKLELAKKVFEHMEFYDVPPREFELAELTYDLIVSASCFAQLKRHRMMTLLTQPYDPALGVTVPPSIKEAGEQKKFMEIIRKTDKTWRALKNGVGPAADYILTNAHRRRVTVKACVRELYHLSRLREDATAQWEIRRVSAGMSALAKKVFPVTARLLSGKDSYPELYKKLFGRLPKMQPRLYF